MGVYIIEGSRGQRVRRHAHFPWQPLPLAAVVLQKPATRKGSLGLENVRLRRVISISQIGIMSVEHHSITQHIAYVGGAALDIGPVKVAQ